MTQSDYPRPDILVETEWLEAHLNDPDIRIVDCDQYDLYTRAHIANAVGIPEHNFIKNPNFPSDPTGYPLVASAEDFARLMGRMGIGNDTTVVAYDAGGGTRAARLWWVLNYYGHTKAMMLNGGWKKWHDEGWPTSTDALRPPEASFTSTEVPDLVCLMDYGVSCVGDPDTVFLDVRSEDEWTGAGARGNKRAGHVPGAVHLEWLNFVTSDKHQTVKPAHELRAMLEESGVTPDKQVITY